MRKPPNQQVKQMMGLCQQCFQNGAVWKRADLMADVFKNHRAYFGELSDTAEDHLWSALDRLMATDFIFDGEVYVAYLGLPATTSRRTRLAIHRVMNEIAKMVGREGNAHELFERWSQPP